MWNRMLCSLQGPVAAALQSAPCVLQYHNKDLALSVFVPDL